MVPPLLRCWLFLGLVAACACVSEPVLEEAVSIDSVRADPGDGLFTETELQWEVGRAGRRFAAAVSDPMRELVEQAPTAARRAELFRLRREVGVAVLDIVTGPSPAVNLLDLVVFVTLQRITFEQYWLPEVFAEQGKPLMAALRQEERDVWRLAGDVLSEDGERDLRSLIDEWRAAHPDQQFVAQVRLGDFVQSMHPTATERSTGLLRELDEATHAVDQTRVLGERLSLILASLPGLTRIHAQEAFYDFVAQEEFQRLLANSESFATAADEIALTLEQIREGGDDGQAGLRPLLVEVQRTMTASTGAAGAFASAARALDDVLQRIYTRPPARGGRAFNIVDYSETAQEVEEAAIELNALAGALERLMIARSNVGGEAPRLVEMIRSAERQGELLSDHVFRRGVVLIAIFLGGSLLSALIYRLVIGRMGAGGRPRQP